MSNKENRLKATAEIHRRKQFEKYRYYKVPKYFEGVMNSDAHTKLLPCPNRVGKSTYCLFEAYWTAMDCHPVRDNITTPNITWLVGPTKAHIKEVFLEGFNEWGLNKFFEYKTKEEVMVWHNGSKTYVKSYDERKNLQGRAIRKIIMDEESPPDIWMELAMRFKANEPLDILVAATPIDCYEWFDDICERAESGEEGLYLAPEISIMDASVKNGGHLSEENIKRIDQLCVDDRERQVRMFGKRIRRAGAVLPLDAKVHLKNRFDIWPKTEGQPPSDWMRIIGIDPHARKPTAVVWIAFDPKSGDAYVYDHARLEGTCKQQALEMKVRNKGQSIFCIYIDPAAKYAMSSNMASVDWNYFMEFQMVYGSVPLVASVKQPEFVIDSVRHRLKYNEDRPLSDINKPHLYFLDNLQDLYRSMKSVRWMEYKELSMLGKKEQIKKGNEDDLMALGYALVKHPMYVDMLQEDNEIELDEADYTVHNEMGY